MSPSREKHMHQITVAAVGGHSELRKCMKISANPVSLKEGNEGPKMTPISSKSHFWLIEIYQCYDSELRCNTTKMHVTLNSKLVNVFLNLFAHYLTSEMLNTLISKFQGFLQNQKDYEIFGRS